MLEVNSTSTSSEKIFDEWLGTFVSLHTQDGNTEIDLEQSGVPYE